MKAKEIVALLEKTDGPSRFIDKQIAVLTGWKRRINNGTPEWHRSSEETGMPFYTRSIEAARSLAYEIAPHAAVACVWHESYGTAVIDGGATCRSPSAPLALCLAAMKIAAENEQPTKS